MKGAPGPKVWCHGWCGVWVEDFSPAGGAVLVRLGLETYWFCGPCCAAGFMDSLSRTLVGEGREDSVMLLSTLSEN